MKNKLVSLLIASVLFNQARVMANPIEDGKSIFISRCAGCHNVNRIITGPALAGIDQRRPIDWVINFIRSSQSLVKKGDSYAITLYQKFNRVVMPDHTDLTDDNIKSIVAYINSEAKNPADKAPFARPGRLMTPYTPLSIQKDYLFFIGYLGVVALLIGIMLMAVRFVSFRNKIIANKNE